MWQCVMNMVFTYEIVIVLKKKGVFQFLECLFQCLSYKTMSTAYIFWILLLLLIVFSVNANLSY